MILSFTVTSVRSGTIRCGTALGLVVLSLAGCTVGPDFEQPAAPPTAGYTRERLRDPGGTGRGGQHFAVGRDVPGRWWALYGSRDLDYLVEASLAANPTIEAAEAAVRIAQQNTLAQIGTLFPQVGFGGVASRLKTASGDLTSNLTNNAYTYNLYTPQLTVAFSPDVFGGNRRQIESLEAQRENQRYQLEASRVTLATNVVSAAVQEASLRGQIEATRKVIALQEELLVLFRKQVSLGQSNGMEVAQQEAALAQSRQLLPPLEKQLAQQRNLLTVLAGRVPADEIRQRFTLASLRLPKTLPVSVPADLVRQRPDVRAAEASLQSASAGIGVAVANRLPQFALTANAGLNATRLASLAVPGAQFYTLAGAVAQPIFDAGTLFHRQESAKESFAQADAQYRATVLSALQSVADCLRALQVDARAVASAHDGVGAARRSLDLTRVQLQAGQTNFAALILAQQLYLQALINEVQAEATRLADTAALFQALGGGWWNRPAEIRI